MDAVRFGRALGSGARQAVKTLVTAVDAATAENPSGKGAGRAAGGTAGRGQAGDGMGAGATAGSAAQAVRAAAQTAAQSAAKTVGEARKSQQGLRRESRRFGKAVWGPFVRLSGVLWLEVTGVFFGIFALFAGLAVWRLRGAWRLTGAGGGANAGGHRSLEGAVAMLAVFGYFCVSSFVRARRRERGR